MSDTPKLLRIFYDPNGRSDSRFGDYELEEKIFDWWKSAQSIGSQILSTDQSLVIAMAQALILENKIPKEDIEVNIITKKIGGSSREWETYKIDSKGNLYDPKMVLPAPQLFHDNLYFRV